MLMTKCLVLICGPPACLKSTLIQILRLIFNDKNLLNLKYICIKKLQKNFHSIHSNFLCFDDLFIDYENLIIQNEFNWKLYRSLIANEIEKIILLKNSNDSSFINLKYSSEICQRIYQSLNNLHQENILFIEDNFYYASMRHRYRQIAQRGHMGFLIIHLYSDKSIVFQRNEKRDLLKRVSNNSIENIYSKYELSNDGLVIDTTERGITTKHLHEILQAIEKACQQPEQLNTIDDEQRRIDREINEKNVMYQIDQKLRKFISKYLKEQFETNEKFQIVNEKKMYAEMINEKRQQFLELLKQKLILLNDNDDIERIFQEFLQENN